MSIALQSVYGNENIAASRINIHNNFMMIQDAINTLDKYVNISNGILNGFKNLSLLLNDTSRLNEEVLTTDCSIGVNGNGRFGKALVANNATFASDVVISNGGLRINSSLGVLDLKGDFKLTGEFILNDFLTSDTYIDAFSRFSFSAGNILQDIQTSSIIGGIITPKGMNSIILNWRGFDTSNSDTSLYKVQLSGQSSNLNTGQILEIIAMVRPGYSFYLSPDTLQWPGKGITTYNGIKFTQDYQSVRVVWDGSAWIVLNMNGAVIE